jgi:hypothetical protein
VVRKTKRIGEASLSYPEARALSLKNAILLAIQNHYPALRDASWGILARRFRLSTISASLSAV